MNANTENMTLDLGAMMEETLDDIPEAPDFTNPPAGEYVLSVKDAKIETYTAKPKKDDAGGERDRLKFLYTIEKTISVSGNEPPVPDGSIFSETFQATTQGVSYFKKRVKDIMNVSDMTGVKLGELLDSVKGISFEARITIRKSPNPSDPLSPYENVQIRVVPPKAVA